MISQQEQINIGNWIELEGNYGLNFTITGDIIAGYQDRHLSIWKDRSLVLEQSIGLHAPGYPIIDDDKVYSGPGWIDVNTKKYEIIPGVKQNYMAGLGIEAQDILSGYYLPVFYVWLHDTNELLVSLEWKGKTRAPVSRVLLLDGKGDLKENIYEGNTPPSKAMIFTKDAIAIGGKEIKIFDRKGNLIKELKSNMIITRLEYASSQNLLLSVSANEIVVWDATSWNLVDKHAGSWLDASISTIGNVLAAVDSYGKFYLLPLNNMLGVPQKVELSDGITSVSIGEKEIVALFTSGAPIRIVEYDVK